MRCGGAIETEIQSWNDNNTNVALRLVMFLGIMATEWL